MKNKPGWAQFVKEKFAGKTDQKVVAKDQQGNSVAVEWKITRIDSPELARFKQEVCPLACAALAPVEVEFLKAHPEAASQEPFLKSCAPYFENGLQSVDWEAVRETVASTMKQFYLADLSAFGPAAIAPLLNDTYLLGKIKDPANGELLAFAMLAITPSLPDGDVKVINLALAPERAESGLDHALIKSVLQVLPELKRLFVFARPTNTRALQHYREWGFVKDLHPVQDPHHKTHPDYQLILEYRVVH